MKKLILILSVVMLFASWGMAQVRTAPPSPGAKLEQQVGLTDVVIEYSRPSVKDRKIMGDLVPYGEVWRTGANAATKISFSEDVVLGGKDLSKGEYALLTKPGAEQWKVMLYEYKSGNYNSYLEEGVTPAIEFSVKPEKIGYTFESFLVDINNLRNDKATIDLLWENTRVSLPLMVHTDKQTMASIEKTMSGPSNNDYYQAAVYFHESGHDLEKAYKYIDKATSMGEPMYWQMRRKALILADMGKVQDAIAAAKTSKELAEKAGNQQYVKFNDASIKEWMSKKDSKSMNE